MHVFIYIYIYMHMSALVDIYVYTYTHIYICIYIFIGIPAICLGCSFCGFTQIPFGFTQNPFNPWGCPEKRKCRGLATQSSCYSKGFANVLHAPQVVNLQVKFVVAGFFKSQPRLETPLGQCSRTSSRESRCCERLTKQRWGQPSASRRARRAAKSPGRVVRVFKQIRGSKMCTYEVLQIVKPCRHWKAGSGSFASVHLKPTSLMR